MSPHENDVIVNLKLRIPLDGWQATLRAMTGDCRTEDRRRKQCRDRHDRVIYRPAPAAVANARVAGDTNYICAEGNIVHSSDPTIKATKVFAEVKPGISTITNPPANPPAGAVSTGVAANGDWMFHGGNAKEIPGAICDIQNPPPNLLLVWYQWSDGTVSGPDQVPFEALCTDHTDCDEPIPFPHECEPELLVKRVAAAWRTSPRGFGGQARAFNADWKLVRLPAPGGLFVWVGGGDGQREPRVELSFDCPCNTLWRLTFRLETLAVEYSHRVRGWNLTGPNRLTSVRTAGLSADDSVPPFIVLEPCK